MPDPALFQQRQQLFGLFGHRHHQLVQMFGGHCRHRPWRERDRGDLGEPLGVDAQHHLRQQVLVPVLQRHRARIAAQRRGLQLGEHLRDVLERPVLQQPGEQQVADLQQRQVLLVVDLPRRQQPGRLEIEQRRGDHQERGGLLELHLGTDRAGVGDEFVGDLMQRHFGDVEAVGENQLQQQVERPLEIGQPDLEAVLGGCLAAHSAGHAPNRSITSRANDR